MKWLCALLATAALFAGVFVPVGRAESTGSLAGLQAICLQQGGSFQFGTPAGEVACHDVGFVIHRQIPGSIESSQLVAIDRLCKAAGFTAVREFGKGTPDGGFLVETWACV
jgi:hypothetical protein